MDVKITDNTQEVLSEFDRKIKLTLSAMGELAEKYAKEGCPVDTGRLRNSITHQEDKMTTIIGTNVEYAQDVELNHKTQSHFLRNAVTTHSEEYETLAKKLLK
jgi:phage gpG-like protein